MKKRLVFLTLFFFVLSFVFAAVPAAYAAGLTDIKGHWAETAVQQMVNEGIIKGYPDNTFKPDRNITRAEFATIIVKAFGLKGVGNKVFEDTQNHWAKDNIALANAYGIVAGYNDKKFGPDDLITREQAAVMIVKAAKIADKNASLAFADAGKVSPWAKDAVASAAAAGIIKGYPDNTFKPQGKTTRAEAAVIVAAGKKAVTPPPVPVQTKYDKAGVYGPASGSQTISADVVISASGVVLQNTVIKGNLDITEGVGEGDVTLKNVEVTGTTTIKGGGENSIKLENVKLAKVAVNKANGKIRLVLDKNSQISELTLDSAAKITGEGVIVKAYINKDGAVLEIKPGEYKIASGVTAVIAGKTEKGTTVSTGGGGGGSSGGTQTQQVAAPTASPPSGAVKYGTKVILTSATQGAEIYYTLDGSTPDTNSSKYAEPITITYPVTIKAIAVKSGMTNSVVQTFSYTINDEEFEEWMGEFWTLLGALLPADKAAVDSTSGNITLKDESLYDQTVDEIFIPSRDRIVSMKYNDFIPLQNMQAKMNLGGKTMYQYLAGKLQGKPNTDAVIAYLNNPERTTFETMQGAFEANVDSYNAFVGAIREVVNLESEVYFPAMTVEGLTLEEVKITKGDKSFTAVPGSRYSISQVKTALDIDSVGAFKIGDLAGGALTFKMYGGGNNRYTYTINLRKPSSVADLAWIKVGGTDLSGFDPAKTSYNYEVTLQNGMVNIPAVTAAASDSRATVKVTQPGDNPPYIATIEVTAENGATKTYTINFQVVLPEPTLEEVRGTIDLVITGVYNLVIPAGALEEVFGSFLAGKKVKLLVGTAYVEGADENENTIDYFIKQTNGRYLLPAVQGYTENQLKAGKIVLEQ